MFIRFSDTPLHPNSVVFGGTGQGVLAQDIPSTGTNGASFLYNDVSLPADNGKYIRAMVSNRPTVGDLFIYENGSFSFENAPNGVHTFTYQLHVDGVPTGSLYTVTMEIGGATPFSADLTKASLLVEGKLLQGMFGTTIPFNANINKTGLVVDSKPLTGLFGVAIPFNGSNTLLSLPINGKQLSGVFNNEIAYNGSVGKAELFPNNKSLSVAMGMSVGVSSSSLSVSGKQLFMAATIPVAWVGAISKRGILLEGKLLTVTKGWQPDLPLASLVITNKQISLAQQVHPVVPVSRVFSLDSNKSYYSY